jgi:hypothetical protein
MAITHRDHVEALLRQAPPAHAGLVAQLPADLQMSLPVDAQGVTQGDRTMSPPRPACRPRSGVS